MTQTLTHSLSMIKTDTDECEMWDFSCPHCGYQIRYTRMHLYGEQILEVVDRGDPKASHYSPHLLSVLLNGNKPSAARRPALPPQEEETSPLPPHLADKISQILEHFE